MLALVLRRLGGGALVVFLVAALAYGIPRALAPQEYGGEPLISGLLADLRAVFLHFDFGNPRALRGDVTVRELWARGAWGDVWLLAGALVAGIGMGVAGGVWCAARPRSRRTRALEWAAIAGLCAPPFVVGYGVLLLFNPTFGAFPLPLFFDAEASDLSITHTPWHLVRTLLVPWVILGLPIAALCLRQTLALTIDSSAEPYIDVARAKGLREATVVRRHAARPAYVGTAALLGVSLPFVLTNVVLVERVFSVPGFFVHAGPAAFDRDLPVLQGMAVWGAVLIVVLSLVADALVPWLDPRRRGT